MYVTWCSFSRGVNSFTAVVCGSEISLIFLGGGKRERKSNSVEFVSFEGIASGDSIYRVCWAELFLEWMVSGRLLMIVTWGRHMHIYWTSLLLLTVTAALLFTAKVYLCVNILFMFFFCLLIRVKLLITCTVRQQEYLWPAGLCWSWRGQHKLIGRSVHSPSLSLALLSGTFPPNVTVMVTPVASDYQSPPKFHAFSALLKLCEQSGYQDCGVSIASSMHINIGCVHPR